MKNLHLIATDKPSRLYYNTELPNNFIHNVNEFPLHEDLVKDKFQAQNIYITNDELIKKNDWYIADNKLYRASVDHNPERYTYGCKKIILTNDQDLIKDGVQAIDDEFLEWFVNNPSCKEVETFYSDKDLEGYWRGIEEYQIIIPKEEPKTGSITEWVKTIIDNELKELEIMKKETIEELAEKYWKMQYIMALDESTKPYIIQDFIAGYKLAQEQNKKFYTEEEVYSIIRMTLGMKESGKTDIEIMEQFEQFKKK
jgi:hypothetical protein